MTLHPYALYQNAKKSPKKNALNHYQIKINLLITIFRMIILSSIQNCDFQRMTD